MASNTSGLLDQLHQRCITMGGMVQGCVRFAVEALVSGNTQMAQDVFAGEEAIDQEEVEIEKLAINLLALHQPAASDLRMVFAIVKINSDLERIADCAVNVAQQAETLAANNGIVPRDLRDMARATLKQVEETVRCYSAKDEVLAEQICHEDDAIDALYTQVFQDTRATMMQNSQNVPAGLAIVIGAKNLERMGDHCTNIAENVLYRMRGTIVRHTHEQK